MTVKKKVKTADSSEDQVVVELPNLQDIISENLLQTQILFLKNNKQNPPIKNSNLALKTKYNHEYSITLPSSLLSQKPSKKPEGKSDLTPSTIPPSSLSTQLVKSSTSNNPTFIQQNNNALVKLKEPRKVTKPAWHAPWKLMRVISGHLGPVRCVDVDASNEWFVTGAGDRIIKVWDMASGHLKLSLTGHISTVRGVCVSPRHPYLFSCGEDKLVKCWDLEQNKVIRHYHGHLSGVYSMALHPTLDLLVTTGRDSTARVWDMRSRTQVFALTGHQHTVYDVFCQPTDPQIVTSSADATIKLWDLAAGKCMSTLTHHKKGIRALADGGNGTFVSGSTDHIKQWKFPNGNFMQNFSGHGSIINTLATNKDGVLFSGGDNGSMYFWDYKTGYNFQQTQTKAQPGSLDSECGILASKFDHSGTRLITAEADKSIKVWKEDERATEETHPIEWRDSLERYIMRK